MKEKISEKVKEKISVRGDEWLSRSVKVKDEITGREIQLKMRSFYERGDQWSRRSV